MLKTKKTRRLPGLGISPFKRDGVVIALQFQKRLRLQEARRRLLADREDAATVGFAAGYESPSQFSREYRRMFGAPAHRDAKETRRRLLEPVMAG